MQLIIAGGAFFLSLGLTRLVQHFAMHRGLLDLPNDRSSHTVPTPRGGGVAIVTVFFISYFWLWQNKSLPPYLLIALASSGLVALVGFWDDRKHVPVPWRLLVHFGAAAWAVAWLAAMPVIIVGGTTYNVPHWASAGGAIFFIVWLTNLYNFMDGIDGIAGGEAVTVALGAATILFHVGGHENVLLLLILAGVSLGFLLWNWPPAKIFMGDVGSGFLGFVFGVFALYTPMHSRMSFWSWLILLGVFLADATVTLLVRAVRGERLYLAHRSHAYQHLARKFNNHQKVTIGALGINMFWLFPLAFVATLHPVHGAWLTVLAMAPLIALCGWAGAGKSE